MLRITVVDGRNRRRLIVEGKLIAPWSAELTTACESAKADLQNRKLIVDLRDLAAIDAEGEAVLLQLMREEVKLLCGVYMKEVLKQLARKARLSDPDAADECTDSDI
jgi:ABC-type transporter Mla MlaB component